MNYLAIKNAVSASRFDPSLIGAGTSTTPTVTDWIRAKEGEVWQYADWPIKETAQLNLTVTGGTATIPLPTGMSFTSQGLHIFDQFGYELTYMEPSLFYSLYQPMVSGSVPSTSPNANAWTLTTDVSNVTNVLQQIRVGPTPQTSATYTITGWPLPICRSAASTWKIGTMSADTDLPWWPDDYHFFLVSGAAALGGMLLGDLDYQALEQDFQNGLARLRKELFSDERRTVEVWGEYPLGQQLWGTGPWR